MSDYFDGVKDAEDFVKIHNGIGTRSDRELAIKTYGASFWGLSFDYMEGFYDYMVYYLKILQPLEKENARVQ